MLLNTLFLPTVLLPTVLLPTAHPGILTVDEANGPFFEIHEAISVAQDGDTILVEGGFYEAFTVDRLAVTVAGQGPDVVVFGSVRVQQLDADQDVTLSDFEVRGGPSNDDALIVGVNAGRVQLQGLTLAGNKRAAARVVDSSDVVFSSCTLRGGGGLLTPLPAHAPVEGEAMEVSRSTVTLVDCVALGAYNSTPTQDGPPGIRAADAELFLVGTTVRGGTGGMEVIHLSMHFPPWGPCDQGGDGGPGIRAMGTGRISIAGGQVAGGGAIPPWSACSNGLSAQGNIGARLLIGSAVTLVQYSVEAVTLDTASIGVGGTLHPVELEGAPGAPLLLVTAPERGFRSLPGFAGGLLVGGPVGSVMRRFVGTGIANTSLALPTLPAGTTEQFVLQAVSVEAGQVVLGEVRVVTVMN